MDAFAPQRLVLAKSNCRHPPVTSLRLGKMGDQSNCRHPPVTSLRTGEMGDRASIGALVGSSCYQAFADDALKDEDNAGWVLALEPDVQHAWIDRIRWIRLADRLAEQDLVCANTAEFATLLTGWQSLLQKGSPPLDHPYYSFLEELRQAWFGQHGSPCDAGAIAAWDQYMTTVSRYHQPTLVLETLADYERFLAEMGGGFFQIFPFLLDHQRQLASYMGILDQFYNHLRDLQEDLNQGSCYLPTQVLACFGLTREDLLNHRALTTDGYLNLMQFWLNEYLPRLRRKARQLLTTDSLHPSWQLFCEWSIVRYRRIETTFRECEFNYCQFADVYWPRVSAELPLLRSQIHLPTVTRSPTTPVPLYGHLRGWKRLSILPDNGVPVNAARSVECLA